ncbi:MAG: hypothetical protein JF617_02655 [Burkholderiales bacterium]|nr:hypothetical protein [Burkholderiales bacterium]
MKYPIAIAAGIAGSFFVAQAASACTADAGKLTECKVVDNSAAGKGFDKAAMCIAEKLPMGAKTGTVKVPFRFPGGA